jgi:hypothetical protein
MVLRASGHPRVARPGGPTWIVDFYNLRRRHSVCYGMSPIDYERFMSEARQAQASYVMEPSTIPEG